MAEEQGRDEARIRAGLVADFPLKRAIGPEEIAACSVFLASDEASDITGQTLNVTNGAEMR
jgi:NAD(P)-dependent dehydrogenase (short-subunit alcohol dehydrogenase family)